MSCQEAVSQREQNGWEVADIFRLYGAAYRASRNLSKAQQKVMRAIETCRTPVLGGHKEVCPHCGEERCAYNSCRNRHCPKCQTLVKAQWLEDRKADLLPVPYFHGVFTLPHDLNALVLYNKRLLFNMLFSAVSQTLLEFGRNNLGGKIGFTAILHTWNQLLLPHFHLHCIIPSGALTDDEERWISGDTTFLFHVKALSKVFRGKFLHALEHASENGLVNFPPNNREVGSRDKLKGLVKRLWSINWVVFAKPSFAGPEQVLDYLGRYTHRVAISNHRIVDVSDDHVTFNYRDRRHGNQLRTATADAYTFIDRFLLHVLPNRFMRIRHYGLLASRSKAKNLSRCRQLLGLPADPPTKPKLTTAQWLKKLLDIDTDRCPACGKGPLIRTLLPPQRAPPSATTLNARQ